MLKMEEVAKRMVLKEGILSFGFGWLGGWLFGEAVCKESDWESNEMRQMKDEKRD